MKNKIKILHARVETAGQGINSVNGLRKNGFYADMLVWNKNIYADEPDIDLHISSKNIYILPFYCIKIFLFFIRAIKKYNVMHFHSRTSLLRNSFDCYLYKYLKIKTFSEFHGSDIRFLFNNNVKYQFYKNNTNNTNNSSKYRRRVRRITNNVDGIILHDYELDEHLPIEINRSNVYHVPLRVKVNEIKANYPDKTKEDKPIIVHAPSNRSEKGTDQILEALKKVKSEYELVLVEGKTHDEAMEIYSKADIVIDQISLGTYGVFAIEAMAMGKPVITYMSDDMIERMPDTLPIISSDFDSLPSVVEKLINDPQLRYNKGVLGRKYVERYHDHIKVTALLSKIYVGNIENNDLFQLL